MQRVEHRARARQAAGHDEAHHRAAAVHLPLRQFAIRVARKRRIEDVEQQPAADEGDEPVREFAGRVLLRRDAQVERRSRTAEQPRRVRREDAARAATERFDEPHQFVSSAHDAREDVRVAAVMLRRRMHDEVGAELQRPLDRRRRKRAVDERERSVAAAQIGREREVDEAQRRVDRCLQHHELRLQRELLRKVVTFHRMEPVHLHAEAREVLRDERSRSAVDLVRHEHAVAGAHEREHRAAHRRHAACERHRAVGSFALRRDALELAAVRVAHALVEVAAALRRTERAHRLGIGLR